MNIGSVSIIKWRNTLRVRVIFTLAGRLIKVINRIKDVKRKKKVRMTFKSSTKRGCIYGEPSSSTETNLQDGNDNNKFNGNGQHLKSPHIPTHNVDDNGEFIHSHI